MTSLWTHRLALILGAFAASVASVLIVLMWMLPPQIKPTAADILPARETAVFFAEPSQEQIDDFMGLFPILESAPKTDGASLAIIEYSCGEDCTNVAWVSITEKRGSEETPDSTVIGPWRVQTSSPALLPLLSLTEPGRLSALESFQAGHQSGKREVYVSLASLPAPVDLTDQMLSTLLRGSSALTLAQTNSGWTIAIANPKPTLSPSIESSITQPLNTSASFALGDGRMLWKTMEERMDAPLPALPAGGRRILYGLTGAKTQQLLGKDVSFTYDVLPLLQKPFTVHIAMSGGTLRYAMAGSMDDRTELSANILQFHRSVEESLPSAAVIARNLDEFQSILVKPNAALLERHGEESNGWEMRTTLHTESKQGLITAERADRFVFGNDPALVESAIKGDGTRIPFPALRFSASRTILAGGIIDLAPWRLEITKTPWKQALLGPILRAQKPIVWSVERNGQNLQVAIINVQ